jgi:hypothetical protein
VHIPATADDEYARLDALAGELDFAPLRGYVVRDYVLQQCVTRPERVAANERYFGELAAPILDAVQRWGAAEPNPGTAAVFGAARGLQERFGEALLARIAALGLRVPAPAEAEAEISSR